MNIPGTRGDHTLRQRAYELADSGNFANAHAVEQALIGEGWASAAQALQGDYARKAINERCQAAQPH